METSVSLLGRLAGAPTDDDRQRLAAAGRPVPAPAPRLGGAGEATQR
jgi:hypothetical protein